MANTAKIPFPSVKMSHEPQLFLVYFTHPCCRTETPAVYSQARATLDISGLNDMMAELILPRHELDTPVLVSAPPPDARAILQNLLLPIMLSEVLSGGRSAAIPVALDESPADYVAAKDTSTVDDLAIKDRSSTDDLASNDTSTTNDLAAKDTGTTDDLTAEDTSTAGDLAAKDTSTTDDLATKDTSTGDALLPRTQALLMTWPPRTQALLMT